MELTWGELAKAAGGTLLSGEGSAPVKGFSVDSRRVRPGEAFVAIPGARSDGNDFTAQALAAGAGGAVVTRRPAELPRGVPVLLVPDAVRALQDAAVFHRARCPCRVTGVTGSNGKTTTKEMVSRILSSAGKMVFSTRGNLNSQIGLPLSVMELSLLDTHAVFEMGASERGNIRRLASLALPDVGVVTNTGRAHLETFGSLEGVADAKWELVESLPAAGLAVLNAEDPRLMARKGRAKCRVVTFGMSAGDYRAEGVRQGPETVFTLVSPRGRRSLRLPVGGFFNVANALAAAAATVEEGLSLEDVARGLAAFTPAPQRMQVLAGKGGGLLVVDAYNANPDSMRSSLESFALSYPDRRRVAVLGGMRELGSQAWEEHKALGALAGALPLDRVYFLGPEGSWVKEGWPPGAKAQLSLAADKAALTGALRAEDGPGAVILFKASRGVQLEEVYTPLLKA